MAVVEGIAVYDAGRGPFRRFVRSENRDADAVVDRGTEGPVPPVLCSRPDFPHERIIRKCNGTFKKIRIHRRVEEVAVQTDGALSLESRGTRRGPIAELEIRFAAHRDFVQRAGHLRCAAILEERGEVRLGVGLRLPVAQMTKVVLQVEQAVAVNGVITSRSLLWRAIREEVVGRENPQGVRPLVVDPIHHVPPVGAVQAAQHDERALAFPRKVAGRTPVKRDLEQGGQHLFRQLADVLRGLYGEAHGLRPFDEFAIFAHQRPDRIVGQREALDQIRGVDAVTDAAFGPQRLNRVLFVRPVRLAPVPGFFHAFRGTVSELGHGGHV